ncbi:MAG: DUF2089 domain-containing protein [Anaerolineales bacterium]|nr:DUF2089 domain-containing protein [Anaerolineales bacterium]
MYHALPTRCPLCEEPITVTQLHCEHCDIRIDGRFEVSGLAALSSDQLEFVEVFLRCEGKINRVEKELGISYPTVRSRLNEIILAMGYEPVTETEAEEAQREASRLDVLERLSTGTISPDQAVELLRKQG